MKPESIVQQEIILEAAKYGIKLMRNNRGAGKFRDEATGNESFVRFGLGNESKEMDKIFKSSDLIGVVPPYGRFIAIEVKKEGWIHTNTPREIAQKAFIDFVNARGGVAGFCSSVVDFLRLIGRA